MKCYVVVFVLTVTCCASESDGFKIVKKLKDILHPEISTTTVAPLLPEYEKPKTHGEDESESLEQVSSTSIVKKKHSSEDLSNSQSSETFFFRDSFINTDKKLNNAKPDKTYTGDVLSPNAYVSTPGDYDIVFGISEEKQLSPSDKFNYQDPRTTTKRYDQSINNNNYPGQSSSQDSFYNRKVESTTQRSYESSNQNQPEQSFGGFNNQKTLPTIPRNYDESYNTNKPEQSTSFGGASFSSAHVVSSASTPKNPLAKAENHDNQTSIFGHFNKEETNSTTPRNDDSYYGINKAEKSSSAGDVTNYDMFSSASKNTTTVKYPSTTDSPQYQNNDGQLPFSSSFKKEVSGSTTQRTDSSSYQIDNPNRLSSYDSFGGQNTQTTTNKTQNRPDQSSSFDSFGNRIQSTTVKYQSTNYHEVQPEVSSANTNSGLFITTPSTTESSFSRENQQSFNSKPQTSYSMKGADQTKYNNGGVIIYPDSPSLSPAGEGDPTLKPRKVTPVPVTDEESRHIIDANYKECAPGYTLDKTKNTCVELARK